MTRSPRSTAAVDDYYERFSLEVGLQDWTIPNGRHEQLKAIVGRILEGRRDLRLLDVGCGAGVMAASLTTYGEVAGIDLSTPAIELARQLVPKADFVAGRLEDGVLEGPFDVITLFDVLEHVPSPELPGLLAQLDARLGAEGIVVASTPHPDYIRWLRRARPELLQVVDEPVELREMLDRARALAWELQDYRTYDIDRSGQYQLMAFRRIPARGGRPHRAPSALRRERVRTNAVARSARRIPVAARLRRTRGRGWALWALGLRRDPPTR